MRSVPFAAWLKVADRVPRPVIAPLAFKLAANFGGLALYDFRLYRHRFYRERICLLNIQPVVAGGKQAGRYPDEKRNTQS